MRTTLTIEDRIARDLKKLAHRSGKPFKVVVNETLQAGLEALGRAPDPAQFSAAGGRTLPQWVPLATWSLEAVGLSALFLMIHARSGARWLTGLLAGWIAWVFRGPLLVVSVVGIAM